MKEPSPRAWAIADGLVRTGRGSSATAAEGFSSLFARGGERDWVSFDGHRVLRGRTLESADELQSGFIEPWNRLGRHQVSSASGMNARRSAITLATRRNDVVIGS